jgi:hypothetical protein
MTATLRTDFDAFLFASIGEDANGLPLTLLTVLARLGVDPWQEAEDLAALPIEPAMQRLVARLEATPNGPASATDTVNVANRLIKLLHRPPARAPAPAAALKGAEETPLHVKVVKQAKAVNPAIYVLIGLIVMLIATWF